VRLRSAECIRTSLAACRAELLEDNYFHAVLEATKSLAEKIRRLTGLSADGAPLADAAFQAVEGKEWDSSPAAAEDTETLISEHSGLHNIIQGHFRGVSKPDCSRTEAKLTDHQGKGSLDRAVGTPRSGLPKSR
jgi:uncharacterized protein (TIGR02391 family)